MSSKNGKQSVQKVLQLKELFSMPLISLIDANMYGAQRFAEFIKNVGFESVPNDNLQTFGEMRTVSFAYQQPMRDGTSKTVLMKIPLLSLIPLPNLTIDHADLQFKVHLLVLRQFCFVW